MTPEEILEGNKLIAEFVEAYFEGNWFEQTKEIAYTFSNKKTKPLNLISLGRWRLSDMKFHSSWDWLMPVIEKIESDFMKDKYYKIIVTILLDQCRIDYHREGGGISLNASGSICRVVAKDKIEATYLAVSRFIIWYNQQTL